MEITGDIELAKKDQGLLHGIMDEVYKIQCHTVA